MVVRAYAVCIGVTPECRWMELEMIRDGRGHVDEADEAYHDRQHRLQPSRPSLLIIAGLHLHPSLVLPLSPPQSHPRLQPPLHSPAPRMTWTASRQNAPFTSV